MSSASPCARKVTVRGVKVDLDRYAVWARSSDGTISRVRHRDDLDPQSDYCVAVKSRSLSSDDVAAFFDNPLSRPDVWHSPKPSVGPVATHQGGPGHLRDPRSALILATLGTWRGGDTFHESAEQRSRRLRSLVQQAVLSDPDWLRDLIPFVRSEGNMRTVSIQTALDAAAMGHPDAADLIKETLQRADEPGVALQYWLDTYGKAMPSAVKKGIAAAAVRLYSERNVMRYGSSGKNRASAADVLRLTHPNPASEHQQTLFSYVKARHNSIKNKLLDELPMHKARRELTLLEMPDRLGLMQKEHEMAIQALLSGDKSFKSIFSRAGFSTADLNAWLSDRPQDDLRPHDAKARHAAVRVELAEIYSELKTLKKTIASHRKKAFDTLRSGDQGAEFERVKSEFVSAAAALRAAKADRRSLVAANSAVDHWDLDTESKEAASLARKREDDLAEAYKEARASYLSVKKSMGLKAESLIPQTLKDSLDVLEDRRYDAQYRLESAAKDVKGQRAKIPSEVWETMLPSMGYMELLRNIRNIESSGVADDILATISDRLSDPDEIRSSRQMPLRFWSAAKALAGIDTFEKALEIGVEVSTEAVPPLSGRTLILVDQSGSMGHYYSGSRDIGRLGNNNPATLAEVAALYGAALAKRSSDVDLVVFGSEHHKVEGVSESSVLDTVRTHGSAGMGGTKTWSALRSNFDNHDRVIILSDGQSQDGGSLPQGVPVHFFDLTGHSVSFANENSLNYYSYGGLSDLSFRLFALMEGKQNAAFDLLNQDRSSDDLD